MAKYPITHNTDAGQVMERGEHQFFIRLYIGKAADGTRKYYSKTWKTLERAIEDLFEQKLKRSRGVLEIESSMHFGEYLRHFLDLARFTILPPRLDFALKSILQFNGKTAD